MPTAFAAATVVPPNSSMARFLSMPNLSTLRKGRARGLRQRECQMLAMSTLQQRAREAVDAGFTNGQLAKAAGVSSGAVSQWLSGNTRSLRADSAVGLEKLTGWSASWWATGKLPKERTPLANPLILDAYTVVPKMTTWEAVLRSEQLPDSFALEMPDDALEPRIAKGTKLIFDTMTPPRPGAGVLVEDNATGGRYVRRYVEAGGGAWVAQAVNDAYISLPGHSAKVLAVMIGRLDGSV